MGELIFLERSGECAAWCQTNRANPGARILRKGKWVPVSMDNIPGAIPALMETLQSRHWEYQTARFGAKRDT